MTIGIDEVGRGAWAGPLVVGLVRFSENPVYVGELNDSKLLSKKQREDLDGRIRSGAQCAIGEVSAAEVDELGLTAATRLAIMRALAQFSDIDDILIDGVVNYLKGTQYESVSRTQIKADQTSAPVMAASILAKVYRDRVMAKLDTVHSGYGFVSNVGYGTAQHLAALKTLGICEAHRRSYKPVKECIV